MRVLPVMLCWLLVPIAGWAQGLHALEEAQRALQQGDFDRAIARSTSALAAPDLPPKDRGTAFGVRGTAYGRKGDHAQAVRDFSAAIDVNRLDAAAYYNRGVAYAALLDLDRAILDFSTVIRFDPASGLGYYNRGYSYLVKGRFERAIEDFDEALRINPSHASSWHNRGRAYALVGRPDRAIPDFDAALRLYPSDVASLYERGFAHAARADLERATKDLTTAATLNPTQLPPLPPSATSEYLVTKGSGIIVSKAGDTFVGAYSIFLEPTRQLTRQAHLVTVFQHPTDRDQPIVVTAEITPRGPRIAVVSPAVPGLACTTPSSTCTKTRHGGSASASTSR